MQSRFFGLHGVRDFGMVNRSSLSLFSRYNTRATPFVFLGPVSRRETDVILWFLLITFLLYFFFLTCLTYSNLEYLSPILTLRTGTPWTDRVQEMMRNSAITSKGLHLSETLLINPLLTQIQTRKGGGEGVHS